MKQKTKKIQLKFYYKKLIQKIIIYILKNFLSLFDLEQEPEPEP
jgi:hypothetical protein